MQLSDVEGGNTVFPKAGVFVSPTKGAAALWFNLRHDFEVDDYAMHGGCPVLYGVKWGKYQCALPSSHTWVKWRRIINRRSSSVTNKWIRSASQVFKRPCHLDGKNVLK